MSDEEIMRIGEQLNVPDVATNYINARGGRLNREFEAKKYDVAKDESKKTRKEDYESTMRSLTTEINKLNDLKRKSSESDKSGIDVEIAGKQNELKVLNGKYSDEFGTSFLNSIKVDTKSAEPTTTEVDANPSESTTTVVNTESIVPNDFNWGVTESELNDTGKKELQKDVDLAKQAIDYVNNSKSYGSAKTNVLSSIKGSRKTWSMDAVKDALSSANKEAESYQESQQDKKISDSKEKDAFKKLYDRRKNTLIDPESTKKDIDNANTWLKDHSTEITQYGLN